MFDGVDVDQTCLELSKYQKNPYEHIFKHNELPDILSNVEFVHVYGLSLSPVYENYIDWIERNTPQDCKWEFSWFSGQDKQRIEEFILNHWRIKDRYQLIQLQPINKNEINKDLQ